jgi:alanyl-tRNA synthetase
MDAQEIELIFVDFYRNQGHKLLPRASLLDPSIPMSFVMSAGLVQVEKSLSALSENREGKYVLVQDCFRHFDIDKVGLDSTHLSLFRMPGAFVFGEISSEQTVQLMWSLATTKLKLSPEKLWASYFGGGQVLGHNHRKDIETYLGWRKVGLSENHIIGLGTENNFWIQKNGFQNPDLTRKCGPNTELFYDRGEEFSCGPECLPGCNCGRFVEFSNSLFIKYEMDLQGKNIHNMEIPFTETVIGTERVEMLEKGLISVFETSSYQPAIKAINKFLAGKNLPQNDLIIGERIIADHFRALYHLIADGAPSPGKDGRQRIVKILLRRIITQQFILGIDSNILVLSVLSDIFSDYSGDNPLPQDVQKKLISYFQFEYNRYQKTLQRGLQQIERLAGQSPSRNLTPNQVRDLRIYWGMPEMLTQKILQAGFFNANGLMEKINSRIVL